MHIISKKTLKEAVTQKKYQDAKDDLEAWFKIAEAAEWRNINDVRQTFPSADPVGEYTIFDIRHNRFRLVTKISYAKTFNSGPIQGTIFIRSVLTHREYDNPNNWDKGVNR